MVAVNLPPMVLAASVANGGTVAFGYPDGYGQADFTAARALAEGQVAVNDNDVYLEADTDVAFDYGASAVTVTNATGQAWPAGARVRASAAQLDPVVGGSGPADAVDVAGGVSQSFAPVVSQHFWRVQPVVPTGASFEIDLSGESHSLNLLMEGVDAAVTWSVGPIADGLVGSEGRIVFENASVFELACAPEDAAEGATVRFADGVVVGDLILPLGVGSRLAVYYEVVEDGEAGLVEITGVRAFTVAP